ncbi:MAG: hypothetical protein ABIP51_16135 [Bacteroidia bacterium]
MKNARLIFVFIFLSGMLFTVFQYIPILEEETQNHNTELAKKGSEDDTSGNDGDESDSDSDDAIFHSLNFSFTDLYSNTCAYSIKRDNYKSFFQKINTPPPKV